MTLRNAVHAGFACALLSLPMFAATGCGAASSPSTLRDDLGTPGGQLQMGRYVGWMTLESPLERVGATLDAFVVQPSDLTQFPTLTLLLKLQLGGYGGTEYMTESFTDVHYDFNNGGLTLEEPSSDLQVAALVYGGTAPVIRGDVFLATQGRSGSLHLEFQTDEPGGGDDEPGGGGNDDDAPGADAPFVPALSGQYEGDCDGKRAAMQIVAGKDLADAEPEDRGLRGYGLAARLAYDDPQLCPHAVTTPGGPAWCVSRNFTGGTFDVFGGKVVLVEPVGTTECDLSQGRLACDVRVLDRTEHCRFVFKNLQPRPYVTNERVYHVATTPEQRRELPDPNPPTHAELIQALRGTFAGFIHNETNDQYLPLKLNVMATVSTENPHNENQVFVLPTATLSFRRDGSGEIWAQRFDRRPFYLRPGFILEGPESDGFLQVDTWQTGFIRGVWYSHAFGRVGTVELVKQSTLPPLSASAPVIPPLRGEFTGPAMGGDDSLRWRLKLAWPTQPGSAGKSALRFAGEMNLAGLVPRVNIANGRYDPYTGALAWYTEEDRARLVNGFVDGRTADLMLIWPGAPKWGIPLPTYVPARFARD